MNDSQLHFDPTPVLPLGYYQGKSGPWEPLLPFMSWVGAIYSAAVISGELASALLFAWGRQIAIKVPSTYSLYGALPAVAAAGLLAGCVLCLQRHRVGRAVVVWSSACVVGGWSIAALVPMLSYSMHWKLIYMTAIDRYLLISRWVYGLLNMLYHIFVPIILWIAFRRTDVREANDRI